MTATTGEVDSGRWPPSLAHLLAGDVSAALATVGGRDLGKILRWRPQQVTHQVGRSTTVQYRVTSQAKTGTADTVVVLAHGIEGPTTIRSGGHELVGWRPSDDPHLPGLARALRSDRVGSLLDLIDHPIGAPVLRRRAYRAGRRAVVEATGPHGRVFLKVVRPARAAALVDVHRRSGLTLPVPRVLGCTGDGIVVLSAIPGRTLRTALTALHRTEADVVDRLPGLPELVDHLDRLPTAHAAAPGRSGRRRRDPVAKLGRQCSLIATVLPDLRPDLDSIIAAVGGRLASAHPLVAVHGDLYESQVMVTRGTNPVVCGLLDLDTVGAGHRVDDIANLCAHLSTLALRSTSPTAAPSPSGDPAGPVGRYLTRIVHQAEAEHDPVDLRARIAARVVGLATGPFRVQEDGWPVATARRVELAGAWLRR